ncbi:MAG: Threonine-tRNA ligase, partial [Parcubacteria group bacterium GW2011_GWC2_38_7]
MNKQDLEKMRHSCEHVLTMAMMRLWPGRIKPAMGPATAEGFYFDFDSEIRISSDNFKKIEAEMAKIIAEDLPIIKDEMTIEEARKFFSGNTYKDNEYKQEWLDLIEGRGEKISVYWVGEKGKDMPETFVDICSGPHVESTGKIGAFKLHKVAGAYWHGDEKNKMLQRIYGLAFETQAEIDNYLTLLAEAEKRDHRIIGKDLFLIEPKVGLGLAMWKPKGALLWRVLEDFWYKAHLENGYDLVRSPHIGSRSLWETSGHWNFYNDSMYPVLEVSKTLKEMQDGVTVDRPKEEYLLKPMNCPFHVEIYKSEKWSYKQLPCRWAECGTVYRYEKSGELSGLTRVRGFTQDDAHIICTKEQMESELARVADFAKMMFDSFGFKDYKIYLSLGDPNKPENYVGDRAKWEMAEKTLEKVAQKLGIEYEKEEGEAAFYGPKLDYKVKDALGREWQCTTIQFDFNLPDRFDMTFTNDKGEEEQPFMIHRALFGSFERFMGLLIEHYAGAFPLWLSPEQIRILPVSEKFDDYANEILAECRKNGLRAKMINDGDSLPKRIRNSEKEKVPYVLVVGEKEVTDKTVAVRKHKEG